jgi:hypothetical protein
MTPKINRVPIIVLFILCSLLLFDGNRNQGHCSNIFDTVKLKKIPNFAKTTNEPILLRYKYTKGQKITMGLDYSMQIEMVDLGVKIPIVMKMTGYYIVESVFSNNDASVIMRFSRVTMRSSGPQGEMGFDTDKNNVKIPGFDWFKKMINVDLQAKVTELGNVVDFDKSFLNQMINNATEIAIKQQLDQVIDQMTRGTFIQLSKKPVKQGETYDAGRIESLMDNGIRMGVDISYQVLSVTKSKSQVLLKPIVNIDMKTED